MRGILLFITILPLIAHGQLTLRYKACTQCNGTGTILQMGSSNVTSDYGRRPPPYSRWHMGIDFSAAGDDDDLGYPFMPIETGTVTAVSGVGYKRIAITGAHRFAYGHIFFNGDAGTVGQSSGDFILKKMDAPFANFYAIIYHFGNTAYAIGQVAGTVRHPAVNGGNPIPVTNQVTDINRPIAPIGNSSDGKPFSAHIHLYNFQNDPIEADFGSSFPNSYNNTFFRNPKNPLQFLDHAAPTYAVTFQTVNLVYPGSDRSSFRVRTALNGATGGGGYPVSMDVDGVEFFIKKKYDVFSGLQYYKGPVLESKIFYGGRLSTDRYPSRGFPPHNVGASTIDIANGAIGGVEQVGSATLTGMVPFAYNTQPYDEFWFSDFYSRIHKDDNFGGSNARFAQINSDARYPDGEYNYYVRLTTATGQLHDSPTQTLILDNFKPYIKEVIVRRGSESGPLAYRGFWTWNGSQVVLTKENFSDINPVESIWIKVIMSEPMKFSVANPIAINIASVDGTSYRTMTPIANTDEREFAITYAPIVSTGVMALKIKGFDYGDNVTEKMNASPATVPVRTSSTAWSVAVNPGDDQNHSFKVSTTASCTIPGGRTQTDICLISNFDADLRQANPGNPVVFTNLSTGTGTLQYAWNFGSGASPATATTPGPHTVTYSTTGNKNVSLTVTDVSGSVTNTKTSYISVAQTAASADFTASLTTGQQPLVATFSATYAGTANTYSWTFPGGSPSSSTALNPVVTYSGSGSYNVSLTINGSATIFKAGYINVSPAAAPTASFTYCNNPEFTSCSNNFKQGQAVYFEATVSGGTPLYDYSWNFGDGSTSASATPAHGYLSAGTYTVTLTVVDSRGASVTSTSNITIASFTPQITANWTTSDTYIAAGEGPVVFTDASTSNVDLTYAEYYWDFGDGAFPRYAYSKGPHTVCYSNLPAAKNVFLRIHDPLTNAYDDLYAANHIVVAASNMGQCTSSAPQWVSPSGVASAAAIKNCLFPNEVVGIQNGKLTSITCSTIRNECAFNPLDQCVGSPWFASHGDPSLRNDNGNCFRIYANTYFNLNGPSNSPSEGIYYQHPESLRGGRRYILTFYAKISGEDSPPSRSVLDHLKISLTNGLVPYSGCQDNPNSGAVDYNLPSYPFSNYELGSFEYAIDTYEWKPYEVYFYPPNNGFNQIWIYPLQEKNWLSQTQTNERLVWFLLKDFSLRVDDGNGYPCPPDVTVDNTNPANTIGAGLTLTTKNTVVIANGQEKLYRAGDAVKLMPGFSAVAGSKFTARIGPCETSAGRDGVFTGGKEFDNYLLDYNNHANAIRDIEPAISQKETPANIEVYPNPTSGSVTVKFTGSSQNVLRTTILNIMGNSLYSKEGPLTEATLDVSNFSSGVYLIKIESTDGIFYEEFVRQ